MMIAFLETLLIILLRIMGRGRIEDEGEIRCHISHRSGGER